MEFFNKKQDVLDLKLTQFGRNLLSKGQFKPVYYSFFDDNILYDAEKAGFSELQNASEERIKESQTRRAQVSITSLEREFDFLKSMHDDGDTYDTLQKTAEKNYLLPAPIASMDLNSSHAPAWDIKFLKGEITSSVDTMTLTEKTGGSVVLNIPQLESIMTVSIAGEVQGSPDPYEPFVQGQTLVQDVDQTFFLIRIKEENSKLQKENFDIEIFEIEEEKGENVTIPDRETLRKLSFVPTNLSNTQLMENMNPNIDERYAGYYFDLRVDDEIEDKMIHQFEEKENKTRSGFFSERDLQMPEEDDNRTFDIYEDEKDYPGEIC